jgi:hypothetical protein
MATGTTDDQNAGADDAARRPDGGPRIRASDAERSATVAELQDGVARGLLTHEEGAERMASAFAARFRDELPLLTADLPSATPPAAATPVGWRQLGSGLATQVRYEVHSGVAAGVRSRRFLTTALVAVLLFCFLIALGSLAMHGLIDGGSYEHHFHDER